MKILLPLLIASSLFGISGSQSKVIKDSFNIGKQIRAKDGMTFGYTLASIALTESSAGKNIIGDMMTKHLRDGSLGTYQIRLVTAREIIKKDKYCNEHFKHLLKNEKRLLTMLLTSNDFGAILAGTYLKMSYNNALRVQKDNGPYFHAVSRYNGGSNNHKYVQRVRKNMKIIKKELE